MVNFGQLLVDEKVQRFVVAVVIPLFAAALQGVFAVPNDPSRSGKTVIAVAGYLRLILEFSIFGFGMWCLFAVGQRGIAAIFGIAIVIHYVISYERSKWLPGEIKKRRVEIDK